MENLSMSGETELEDYHELGINLESQSDLDYDIQKIINTLTETESQSSSQASKGVHYRFEEFISTRREDMVEKNKII